MLKVVRRLDGSLDVVTTIQPNVSRRGHFSAKSPSREREKLTNPRVRKATKRRVLVIQIEFFLHGELAGAVIFGVFSQSLVSRNRGVKRFAGGERAAQLGLLLVRLGLLQDECLAVEVVAALSGLFALLKEKLAFRVFQRYRATELTIILAVRARKC